MPDGDPREAFRPDIPSPARMYDYYLGGKDNFPVDRKAAQAVMDLMPPGVARAGARHNRAFLQRAVRYIVTEAGIRQFIDIGAGMPTMGPTHEIAQAIAPETRVVYVDYDPIVVRHGYEMLSGVPHAEIIHHDLRNPEDIYADPDLRQLIDFDQPIALLLVAILPFILDKEDPHGIMRRLTDPLPRGSHLALTHHTAEVYPEVHTAARIGYGKAMSRVQPRSKAEIAKLFDGLELIDPGLVWVPQWHPELEREYDPDPDLDIRPRDLQDAPQKTSVYGAVARKPGPQGSRPAASQSQDSSELADELKPLKISPPYRSLEDDPEARSMTDDPGSPFVTFRPDIPSPARMYDYYLGGKDHYPADRKAAREVMRLMPPGLIRALAWSNRRFMQRVVRYIASETPVRQFLDIGTGLPTVGPVHEVAQAIAPESRIVYVDNDPIVIAHSWEMLSGVPNSAIIRHDLREPENILADSELRDVLDLDQPVAVLLVSVVPFISDDDDPKGIIRRLMGPLAPGSHLVLSHGTAETSSKEAVAAATSVYRRATTTARFRTKAELLELLTGFELVEPGLVWLPQWRPDADTDMQDTPEKSSGYGAVARKLQGM